jgi:acetyl esterase/lipase
MPDERVIRRAWVAAALLLGAVAGACGGSTTPAPDAPPPSTTVEYAPGLSEAVYLPDATGRVPLVVMVPGGGWATSDPSGLGGLAGALAEDGIAAATAHIRSAADGVVYPVPLQDVLCATAAAVAEARARGLAPGPVAVLGHSSGAHLAALAVLAVDDYPLACTSPSVRPDMLIGLSGPYDISRVPDLAVGLFGTGPDDDPASWQAANPVRRAALRPEVPVLLLHGADDEIVPVDFTSQFGEALKQAGHPTTVRILPGVDHNGIFAAEVSADLIARWMQSVG